MSSYPLVPIREIARIHYGKALKAEDRVESGSVAVFGSSGQIGFHNEFLVNHPTLIVGRKGSVGQVTYADKGGWAIDTVFYTEFIKPNEVDIRFFFYALKCSRLERWTITTSIPGLSRNDLYATQIPLPSLEEQRRIVAILDKADAVRRKRQQAIALTEELLRSAFLEMFGDPVTNPKGWEIISLGNISKIQGGLQVTSQRNTHPLEAPYLRVANVYRDKLVLDEIKLIRVTQQELERTMLRVGDLLIVEGHGNNREIGRSSVWDGSIPNCTHQNHLIRVRLNSKIANYTYISAFLNSSGGRRQMNKFGKTTSGLNTISTSNVKAIKVLLPPLSEQKKYSEIKQKIARCLEIDREHFQSSDNLFNSLLQKAFQGEL